MRRKKGRNPDGTGGYEVLESGLIRHHRTKEGKRLKGPARETRELAKAAWEERHLQGPKAPEVPCPCLWQYVYDLCNRESGELLDEQSPSSVALLRSIYNKYVRTYPDAGRSLKEWTPPMARAWAKSVKVQPRTLGRYIAALKGVFRRAKQDGLIKTNPFENVVAPPYEQEAEKRVLQRHEQKELLEHLKGRTRDAAVLWLHGLRRGEAAGLRYEDFDGEGVWIRRQVLELDTGIHVREMTKNRKRRWVPLDEEGKALMQRDIAGWVLPCKTKRPSKEGDAIRERYGKMCARPHNVYGDLVAAVKGTKWEGTHPHDYRSSTGTDLLKTTDPRTAAEIMGHDPKVLAGTYARSDNASKKRAMEARN